MKVARYTHELPNESIKCMAILISKMQITFARAETVWKTKNKKRLIPIFVNKKGLFIYKLAMTVKLN